jgi:hypothetical protein
VGEYAGLVGLYAGEVGLYAGEVGLYAGEVGLYAGEVGLHTVVEHQHQQQCEQNDGHGDNDEGQESKHICCHIRAAILARGCTWTKIDAVQLPPPSLVTTHLYAGEVGL